MFKWIKKLLGGKKSGQEVKEEVIPYKRETRLRIAHDADVVMECKNEREHRELVMELSQLPSFSDPFVWDEVEVKRDIKKDFKEWKENNVLVFNYMNKVNSNVVLFPQAV